jgi:hypothetical protein
MNLAVNQVLQRNQTSKIAMWPSPFQQQTRRTSCECHLNCAIHKMVLALVVKRIGFDKKIGRPWLDVDCAFQHPKLREQVSLQVSQTPFETRPHELRNPDWDLWSDFDAATTCDGYDRNQVSGNMVHETMIRPIIASFVHQTSWAEDLRRFSKVKEAWMDSVTTLGVEFFKTDGLSRCVEELAKDDWDFQESIEHDECDEWWKGFEETRTEHFAQFKKTLEHFTGSLSKLIDELDEVFDDRFPKSLEHAMRRRELELLSVECVREEGERAFLFHHGTAGECFFCTDFVLPERQRKEDLFFDETTGGSTAFCENRWRPITLPD